MLCATSGLVSRGFSGLDTCAVVGFDSRLATGLEACSTARFDSADFSVDFASADFDSRTAADFSLRSAAVVDSRAVFVFAAVCSEAGFASRVAVFRLAVRSGADFAWRAALGFVVVVFVSRADSVRPLNSPGLADASVAGRP